jgi:hypothetical protein
MGHATPLAIYRNVLQRSETMDEHGEKREPFHCDAFRRDATLSAGRAMLEGTLPKPYQALSGTARLRARDV